MCRIYVTYVTDVDKRQRHVTMERTFKFYLSSFFCPSLFLSHLWCHKVSSVTGGEEQAVASPKLLGESKVTDPDGVRISRVVHIQDITRFQVSVYHLRRRRAEKKKTLETMSPFTCAYVCTEVFPHPLAVEVVNSLGDGVEHSTGLSLGEKLLPEDLVEQLSSLHQLCHQVYIPALIIHLTHARTDNLSVWCLTTQNFTVVKLTRMFRLLLTSFRVMMLGCCPYRIRISISSEGSLLILSIIWDTTTQEWAVIIKQLCISLLCKLQDFYILKWLIMRNNKTLLLKKGDKVAATRPQLLKLCCPLLVFSQHSQSSTC